MKKWMVLTLIALFAFSAMAVAEEEMSKNQACALLGNCGNDIVQSAKAMQAECEKMMEKAKGLMDKGKMIRGQGMLWQDKEMETEGQSIYDQGKTMYDKAKAMSDACALLIAQGEQTRNKYKKFSKKSDEKEPNLQGDMIPNFE